MFKKSKSKKGEVNTLENENVYLLSTENTKQNLAKSFNDLSKSITNISTQLIKISKIKLRKNLKSLTNIPENFKEFLSGFSILSKSRFKKNNSKTRITSKETENKANESVAIIKQPQFRKVKKDFSHLKSIVKRSSNQKFRG
ncbi:MAG: hypothetical protein J0H68_01235 [Sphingobacteriia bacterium]|nr:hypothetical protein [Sphingobacteriia bacterium]